MNGNGFEQGEFAVAKTDLLGARARNRTPGGDTETSRLMGELMIERIIGIIAVIILVTTAFAAVFGYPREAGLALVLVIALTTVGYWMFHRRRKLRREADLAALRKKNELEA